MKTVFMDAAPSIFLRPKIITIKSRIRLDMT